MVNITNPENLSLILQITEGTKESFLPLLLYTAAMVIYAIVIFHFYKFLSKRDLFDYDKEDLQKGKFNFYATFTFRYIFLFPLFVFFWFGILSIFLFFLSKNIPVETVLLTSITIIAATRATSYYNEDLSKDLAKMLPFALLGVFIVDPTFFSVNLVFERITMIPTLLALLLQFFLFVIILEFILRLGFSIIMFMLGKKSIKKK
ncbi:hypothetical protein ACFL1H_05375 [Nanoarchaeota archaeon]